MKNVRKFISLLLVFTLMLPAAVIPAFAAGGEKNVQVRTAAPDNLESVFAEGENSLIVFVTGIGQSHSYLFDESYVQEGAFASGTLQDYENYAPLIADGEYTATWNLFNSYFDEAFKDKDTVLSIVKVLLSALLSIVIRKDTAAVEDIENIITGLFSYNMVDENGKGNPRVVTPRYTMPVSEYPVSEKKGESEAKNRFYSSIPCKDIAMEKIGENYEDFLYCFNYSSFSYTSDNVEGLHTFIETIIRENKVGAEDVVLVPMSMGASVVSAYLAEYPEVSENHVRRVVSIVGCWDGSDVLYDLVTKNYADNADELLYNGIVAEMVGEPAGYLVNALLRIFPKSGIKSLINKVVGVLSDKIILSAPSLVALVPSAHYEEVRPLIPNDAARAEADKYYEAQRTADERMTELEKQGVTFSFISGYGLAYGEVTGDYKVFGFMKHAALTNSDEIINIDSTAPGTSYVKPGTSFEDTDGRELSPDGSIDISTTFRKNSSWFFYKQKHELENNNTAIKLAVDLALGNVKTVDDCADPNGEYYYPQFNEARNLKKLNRDYIPDLEAYCEENAYTLTDEQQAVYDKVIAMTENTENHTEADDALIEDFRNMLVEIGVYEPPEKENKFNSLMNSMLKSYNDVLFKIFGAKGYFDIFAS